MRSKSGHVLCVLPLIVALWMPRVLAQQPSPPAPPFTNDKRNAVLITAIEAAAATTLLVGERTGTLGKTAWYLQISERSWILELKGETFISQITGYLWDDDADWLVSFSGTGSIPGKEPIYINGKGRWLYDGKIADHPYMNFHTGVKFGNRSPWGWIVGSEILLPAILGGGTIAAVTFGTGGVGLGVAIPLGLEAAGAGTFAAACLSAVAQDFSETWVTPPPLPERPPVPQNDEKFEAGKGKIVVIVPKNGQVFASADRDLVLSGTVDGGTGTGILEKR